MWVDLRIAISFLTTLPSGNFDSDAELRPPGKAFAYFPLVGLLIGTLLAATLLIAPVWLAPYAVLLVWVLTTGGLHLDGFGDACDGLLATTTPERRLEIMKDPRVGSWATIGLILLLLGKFIAIGNGGVWALVAAPVAGRWAMTVAAWRFPYARLQGTGSHFRQGLEAREVIVASATTAVILAVLAWFDWRVLIALVVAPVSAWAVATFARRRLGGGITGDIYGAICELCELLVMLVIALA
jgi:adenosylcobinamide-GDP ribazoletransferase